MATTELTMDVESLGYRVNAVIDRVNTLRNSADNVDAAFQDDEGWVFRDNLRRMIEQIAVTHVELGRLLAVVDRIDSELPLSGNASLHGG